MTPFKNQQEMLESVVSDLQMLPREKHKRSWNLVIPPGFYSGAFAHELHAEIENNVPEARVAFVSADGVLSPRDLMIQIYYEWQGNVPENVPDDLPPNILLAQLLASVGDGVNVLILNEFHKILTRMDERILVALRDAEQAGRLHTIAISIYPHKWLKQMWKKEGQLLNVSNYGDHKCIDVRPYSLDDIRSKFSVEDIPLAILIKTYEWTGGFPEALDAVFEAWKQKGRPNLMPEVQGELRSIAMEYLRRIGKFVDTEDSTRFSKLLINIHQHQDAGLDYEQVSKFHPWSQLLLDGEGMRADALGDALTSAEIERAFLSDRIAESEAAVTDLAIGYYRRQQYDLAIEVIEHFRKNYDNPRLHLIELHAKVMEGLRGGMSAGACPDVDTEWRQVLQAIADARQVLPRCTIGDEQRQTLLQERYEEIEALAKIVTAACKDGKPRFLDRIGGLTDEGEGRRTAFQLLVFQSLSARGIRGNAAACRAIQELPEQMIRLWGWWKHQINYYHSPSPDAHVWQAVLDNWRHVEHPPPSLKQGEQFPNLYLFYYYIYALELVNDSSSTWGTTVDLEKELSLMDLRNDIAHATVHVTAKMRRKIFELIDNWLYRFEQDCMLDITRESAMWIVSPLDVV